MYESLGGLQLIVLYVVILSCQDAVFYGFRFDVKMDVDVSWSRMMLPIFGGIYNVIQSENLRGTIAFSLSK